MTAFATREVQSANESSFGENSTSFTKRIPVLDVRWRPRQSRGTDNSIQVRQNEQRPGYRGPMGNDEFEIDMYCMGHQTAPSGALVETWQQELLKRGLGGGNVATVGGLVAAGASATSITHDGGTALVRGGVIRIGEPADGRGGGHALVIGATTASPANVLIAAAGAPNDDDVIYATQMAYPTETGHGTQRFLLGFSESGAQWIAHGCFLSGITKRMVYGDIPVLTLRYRVAWWQRAAVTIPSALTLENCDAAIQAGGVVLMQDHGNTTREIETASEITFQVDLGVAEQRGGGGQQHQPIIGFHRLGSRATIKFRVQWATEFETLWDTDGSDTTHQQVLISDNIVNGRSTGLWIPRCFPVGDRPVPEDYNGLLFTDIELACRESTDTTNDLTRAAWMLWSS